MIDFVGGKHTKLSLTAGGVVPKILATNQLAYDEPLQLQPPSHSSPGPLPDRRLDRRPGPDWRNAKRNVQPAAEGSSGHHSDYDDVSADRHFQQPHSVRGNTVIGFSPSVLSAPAGVSSAQALALISFSPATLTFTGPIQAQTTTVTVAVSTNFAGDYAYLIHTTGGLREPLMA